MKSNRMKPYMLNTLLTVAFCAVYSLSDGLGSLLAGLFISALLGVVFYHEHYALGAANSVVVLVIFVLNQGLAAALLNGVPLILLALSLALGTRVRLSVYKLLLLCSVLQTSSFMLNLNFVSRMTGGDVTLSSMMLELGRQLRTVPQLQSSDPAVGNMIEQLISKTVDLSIMLSPAVFMIFSVILSYGLIYIYKKMQQKRKMDMSFLLPFDSLRGDWFLVVVYLALGLILTAAPEGLFFAASANVLLVLSFLFVVLGISVIDSKLQKRAASKTAGRLFLLLILCFAAMFFILPVLVFLICGIADCFFDYRGLQTPRKER